MMRATATPKRHRASDAGFDKWPTSPAAAPADPRDDDTFLLRDDRKQPSAEHCGQSPCPPSDDDRAEITTDSGSDDALAFPPSKMRNALPPSASIDSEDESTDGVAEEPKGHAAFRWPEGADASVLHRKIITTEAELEAALVNRRDDSATVFFAVAMWASAAWSACLGDAAAQATWAADACVEAYFVDVKAVGEAAELLNITTSELPSAHSFHHDPSGSSRCTKRGQKVPHAAIDFISLLCLRPVYGVAHLHRHLASVEAGTRAVNSERTESFVVVYSGATWCPPCCRIMPQINAMLSRLSDGIASKGIHVEVVKADRDTSGTIDQVYDVKLIPTFQVFRASEIPTATTVISRLPVVPPAAVVDDHGSSGDDSEPSAEVQAWTELMTAARCEVAKPIEALQNSQRDTVFAFLERHCAPLSFDDDF